MRNAALIIATVLSVGASYFVGASVSNTQGALRTNLCLTDRAIVNVLQQSLAEVTIQDVNRVGISRWEHQRDKMIGEIQDFKDAAPCNIVVSIPPDIIK